VTRERFDHSKKQLPSTAEEKRLLDLLTQARSSNRKEEIARVERRIVRAYRPVLKFVVLRYAAPGLSSKKRLVASARKGLIHALRRYTSRQKYRFATYATWYVRQAVLRNK